MHMEMNIDLLDLNELPDCEKALIAELRNLFPIAYIHSYATEERTNLAASAIFRNLNEIENISLLRTGSGGRLDGAGVGDHDFILLFDSNITSSSSKQVVNEKEVLKIKEELDLKNDVIVNEQFACTVELIDIASEKELLVYHHSNNKPYPGRILESAFVAGNDELFKTAKLETLKQLFGNKKVLKKIKEELRAYKKNTLSGDMSFKGKVRPQFIDELQVVLYDPKEQTYGLKYGPLRAMQLSLALEFYAALASKSITAESLLDLPTALEDRVRYILRKGLHSKVCEEYLIDFTLVYASLVNIQAKLKNDYHSPQNEKKEIIIKTFKKNSILRFQEIVDEFPLGKLLSTENN